MYELKNKIKHFKTYLTFREQMTSKDNITLPEANMHMIFSGNSGTGKTSVARELAPLLYELKLIKENKIIEIEREDLISKIDEQPCDKINNIIQSALGGILLIDNAHNFAKDDFFTKDIMTALIKAMDKYKHDLIIIFAGYKPDVEELLKLYPMLNSRISYTINFDDYNLEELLDIFTLKLNKYGFMLSDSALEEIEDILNYISKLNNFDNGRFIDKLIQEIFINHSINYENKSSSLKIIDNLDIPSVEELILIFKDDEEDEFFDLSYKDKKVIACHEIGHALTHTFFDIKKDKVLSSISIVQNGYSFGRTIHEKTNDDVLYSTSEIKVDIMCNLGGIAAEKLIYGDTFLICDDDFSKTREMVIDYICISNVDDNSFPVGIDTYESSEAIRNRVDLEADVLIKELYNEVFNKLKENKDLLLFLADYLVEKEEITGEEYNEELNKFLEG